MKARPILFSTQMIAALLKGTKTQTRRIVKPQPTLCESTGFNWKGRMYGRGLVSGSTERNLTTECPYGAPGDLLWCRETWAHYQTLNHVRRSNGAAFSEYSYGLAGYKADGHETIEDFREHVRLMSGCDLEAVEVNGDRWRPSIHMPRWASRLTLRLADVRLERLNDITEADILAEGVTVDRVAEWCNTPWSSMPTLHHAWQVLWDHINGHGAYERNEWCWRLRFDAINENVDKVLARALVEAA